MRCSTRARFVSNLHAAPYHRHPSFSISCLIKAQQPSSTSFSAHSIHYPPSFMLPFGTSAYPPCCNTYRDGVLSDSITFVSALLSSGSSMTESHCRSRSPSPCCHVFCAMAKHMEIANLRFTFVMIGRGCAWSPPLMIDDEGTLQLSCL